MARDNDVVRCDIPKSDYFTRTTFGRLIGTMPMLNFSNVEADAVYLLPGNDQDSISETDLHGGATSISSCCSRDAYTWL